MTSPKWIYRQGVALSERVAQGGTEEACACVCVCLRACVCFSDGHVLLIMSLALTERTVAAQ